MTFDEWRKASGIQFHDERIVASYAVRFAEAAWQAGQRAVDEGWQPIATAPRDGSPVLLYCPSPTADSKWNYTTGFFEPFAGRTTVGGVVREGGWYLCQAGEYAQDYTVDAEPTHWQPLPPPPEQE